MQLRERYTEFLRAGAHRPYYVVWVAYCVLPVAVILTAPFPPKPLDPLYNAEMGLQHWQWSLTVSVGWFVVSVPALLPVVDELKRRSSERRTPLVHREANDGVR